VWNGPNFIWKISVDYVDDSWLSRFNNAWKCVRLASLRCYRIVDGPYQVSILRGTSRRPACVIPSLDRERLAILDPIWTKAFLRGKLNERTQTNNFCIHLLNANHMLTRWVVNCISLDIYIEVFLPIFLNWTMWSRWVDIEKSCRVICDYRPLISSLKRFRI